MATTKGPLPLTEAEFLQEITDRLEGRIPLGTVRAVVKALKEEAVECLANGYKVSLSGLFTITPQIKAGRKKGTVVRNPFDQSERTLRSDEPDKFKVKAKASPAIIKNFPTTTSAVGKELAKQLTPARRSPISRAPARKAAKRRPTARKTVARRR